jgi:hypothetical protein
VPSALANGRRADVIRPDVSVNGVAVPSVAPLALVKEMDDPDDESYCTE